MLVSTLEFPSQMGKNVIELKTLFMRSEVQKRKMMAKTVKLLNQSGEELKVGLPKVTAVHPFGSKILVAVLKGDEIMGGGSLIVPEGASDGGAPQAYIVEVGPDLPATSGLKAGQRIYWTGKGTSVADPREDKGRVRAILDINNVIGILEE